MPRVSVIVPNYNHAPHLDRRLRSVLGQTFTDFELIFLDDASTDDSLGVLARYRSDPRVRVVVNGTNSGSPFKQWNKGVRHATGEYVWIAESDDEADERLLETLVAALDEHPAAGMACCESWLLYGGGPPTADNTSPVRSSRRRRIWTRDFFLDGRDVCINDLLFANTIPNASAVLFRKSAYEDAGGADESMRLCGDWLLYARILAGWGLVHRAARLNYFRCHAENVRTRNRASANTLTEI